jgi:hypothetical protein
MATTIYATPNDYLDVLQVTEGPDNLGSLLRSASLLIARNIVAAYYATNDAGVPTDAAIVEALKEACCIQASVWAGLGVDPNRGGLDVAAPKRGKGIGSARVDYDTSALSSSVAFAARQALLTTLCPDAEQILRAAGLLTSTVWTYG